MPKVDKFVVGVVLASMLLLGGIVVWAASSEKNGKNVLPRDRCVAHGGGLSYHVHPNLEIYALGEPVKIPANVGITPSCMKALHTHDESGKIHIEYPRPYDFTLADFFANWGKVLSPGQILDYKADENHLITISVDDKKSEEFDKLVLKDGEKIVIRFEEKRAEATPSSSNK